MNVLRHLKPESSDTREETVHDSDRIWLDAPSQHFATGLKWCTMMFSSVSGMNYFSPKSVTLPSFKPKMPLATKMMQI